MKYLFKSYIVILALVVVSSCSTVETCILPDFYNKTEVSGEKSIYPYSFRIYSLDVDEISKAELKEYPKCDFKKLYSRDYLVVKWVSFENLDKDSKYLLDHLNRLNEESEKDSSITELNKDILKDKLNFLFSGFYTQINNSKVTDRSYDFFYILDENKKLLYEFAVDE